MSQDRSGNRMEKSALRSQLRRRRRNLSAAERASANKRICESIRRFPAWRSARNIATFIAFDGEPSLTALQRCPDAQHKNFFVPVIRAARMRFAPLADHNQLLCNRFGIAEPGHRKRIDTHQLDLVFVSLVGFDAQCNRLGMGGGYYDRHFNFLQHRHGYFRPILLGVAYEVQRASQLPIDDWDIPLQAIVTDRGITWPSEKNT